MALHDDNTITLQPRSEGGRGAGWLLTDGMQSVVALQTAWDFTWTASLSDISQ